MATGSAPFTYQWMVGSTPVAGATSSVYSIPKTIYAYHNGLKYSVIVADSNGSTATSNTALLTVNPIAPVITETPPSETVDAGSNALFAVAAHGTLPLSYQWNLNGASLAGATMPQYATSAVTYAQNNQNSYTVTVTNGAGQSITSAPALLTVSQTATNAQITVDASEPDASVAHQVTYKRGEVIAMDPGNATPSQIVTHVTNDYSQDNINLATMALQFELSNDQGFFDYNAGPPMTLTADIPNSAAVTQTFSMLRGSLTASQLPVFVQISGTPYNFASQVDPNYEVVCGAAGNFYPLPLTGAPTQLAQSAISTWIEGVQQYIPDAVWIGTQEPTHTLGYSKSYDTSNAGCSTPGSTQINSAQQMNISRFVSYWTPIAQSLASYVNPSNNPKITVGGVQPNAGDSPNYAYAEQQIVSAGMPLNYFTIQNYSPSPTVVQAAYSAYQQLQLNPNYSSAKVMMDRYGLSLSGYSYTNVQGMMQYLIFESQMMPYADMLYGYSVETAGLHTTGSLLPQLFPWLQNAPAPFRPLTTTNSDVQAFALVQTSGTPSGRIAIWNNSPTSTTRSISLTLSGYPNALSSSNVTLLQGSGQAISPYSTSGLSFSGQTISGLSLAPNQFFLINVQ